MTRAAWLADVLTDAGLTVRPYPGWETRGGSDFDPRGILIHHTVTRPTASDAAVDRLLAVRGSSRVPAPLCQYSTNRDGSVSVIAAGTANHGGVGRWNGVAGNRYWFGDEMKNWGTAAREPWTARQVESALIAAAAILTHIGADASWMAGHKEYATPPGRKVDPHSLNMNTLRATVATIMEDKMRQPDWISDQLLDRLAAFNIVPRADESEDMWRTLAFLDRLTSSLSGGSGVSEARIKQIIAASKIQP